MPGCPEGAHFDGVVADAAELDTLAARFEAAGVPVRREPVVLADQRCVMEFDFVGADPTGNRLEAFHGAAIDLELFQPGRNWLSGFRTARWAWATSF